MRVLVFGGRDYKNVSLIYNVLDSFHERHSITTIIEGGATGVDSHAASWALSHNIPVDTFLAEWNIYGKAAGPIRNRKMITEGKPDYAIAFPGGRGTADMIRQARTTLIPISLYQRS